MVAGRQASKFATWARANFPRGLSSGNASPSPSSATAAQAPTGMLRRVPGNMRTFLPATAITKRASSPKRRLAGAAIEHCRLRFGRRLVECHAFRIKIKPGPRLGGKVLVVIDSANQCRAVVRADCLAHVGRDVPDGQADAPIVRLVGR